MSFQWSFFFFLKGLPQPSTRMQQEEMKQHKQYLETKQQH